MTEVDWRHVEILLNVAEKCTGHTGKLSSLMSAAIKELLAINDEVKADAVAEAEAAKQAEIDAQPKMIPAPAEDDEETKPTTPTRRV